jgi:tetratricopeptide (TPR) repeat protein
MSKYLWWFVFCAFPQPGLMAQSEYPPLARTLTSAALTSAYAALHTNSYEAAVAAFREAIEAAPSRADIRKDLAYTLLKIGENEAALEQFEHAMNLDPADQNVALEFAFLSFERRTDPIPSKALARRVFDRIRRTGNAVAEQAFQNIDRPLREGIAKWKDALEIGPESFSAHYELAQLAEQRDEFPLAAAQYLKAREMMPTRVSVLIDLARVYKALNLEDEEMSVLLAASRSGEPRTAERARELLPARYPYVYEFRLALQLDPANTNLHRELAYLLLAMNDTAAAEAEFHSITRSSPEDLLSAAQLGFLYLARNDRAAAMPLFQRVLDGNDAALAARVRAVIEPHLMVQSRAQSMAERSLKAGFLKDALRYLNIAHEAHPGDYDVMLKLGWTYNMLHDDRTAIQWFDLARQSPDASVANEASRAYENLRPETKLFRTTAWILPFYSTRWHDLFAYGQIKTELNTGHFRIRPYLSMRLIADTKPVAQDQPLSERSFIAGVGLSTQWRRFTGWAEAGSAISYTRVSMRPDYRGGLSWARGWTNERKFFAELNADEVFISRFGNDWLSYVQSRLGYRWIVLQSNLTADSNRQHWANFVEAGPGVRFHIPSTPNKLLFSVNFMRGFYLVSDGNPSHSSFSDLRAGFWYAITK